MTRMTLTRFWLKQIVLITIQCNTMPKNWVKAQASTVSIVGPKMTRWAYTLSLKRQGIEIESKLSSKTLRSASIWHLPSKKFWSTRILSASKSRAFKKLSSQLSFPFALGKIIRLSNKIVPQDWSRKSKTSQSVYRKNNSNSWEALW